MRSLIDILDFSVEELDELIQTALDIIDKPWKYNESCKGKKLATLFFEPSTRTRLSFEAAMYELGGNVISVSSADSSSAAKGESVADTVKIVTNYADIIAMRHPKEGAALVAAVNAGVPVINAGDGGHCHPTQTLADLLTIYREKGGFNNLTVGICGDLKYGRTVHSLIGAMSRYENVKFVLISPDELKVPDYVKTDILDKNKIEYTEVHSLEDAIPSLDVLYMTRIQRERFDNPAEYERLKNSYVLDVERMKLAKPDCRILHPLPRVNEISVKVDDDPRAAYFRQALNGKYMRMALILFLLKDQAADPVNRSFVKGSHDGLLQCVNPKCISGVEQELEAYVTEVPEKETKRCAYCDADVTKPGKQLKQRRPIEKMRYPGKRPNPNIFEAAYFGPIPPKEATLVKMDENSSMISSVMQNQADSAAQNTMDVNTCSCGTEFTGKFCPNCGLPPKKPGGSSEA